MNDHFKSNRHNFVYLDSAGAALFSPLQVDKFLQEFSTNFYGNPHSGSQSSRLSTDSIDDVRYRFLHRYFSTSSEEYDLVFTSGATASLRIIADSFSPQNYDSKPHFIYLQDNHTSVLGMRESFKARGCESFCCSENEFMRKVARNIKTGDIVNLNQLEGAVLFAYPAQSNFCGRRYPLKWLEEVKQLRSPKATWYTILDAASYLGSSTLDLSLYKPDFVALSFYKIFGFPTGVGALVVHKNAGNVLKRGYFGGGTIQAADPRSSFIVHRQVLHEKFEDGTLPFQQIIALRFGLDLINELDSTPTSFNIARHVYTYLSNCRYSNSSPVARMYVDGDFSSNEDQGPIIAFNLLRPDGSYIGFTQVDKLAQMNDIHLRTGCFCNLGDCIKHLDLSEEDVYHFYKEGRVCGDQNDLINGRPTGCVRISFGFLSKMADAESFCAFIDKCFVQQSSFVLHQSEPPTTTSPSQAIVRRICIYPIKSCAAFEVDQWEIGDVGLKYDRQYVIVNSSGISVSQKSEPRLCLIKPLIADDKSSMILTYPGASKSVSITLNITDNNGSSQDQTASEQINLCGNGGGLSTKVCGRRVDSWDCGDEVAEWLSNVLGAAPPHGYRLRRQLQPQKNLPVVAGDNSRSEKSINLSLANESQYLLINRSSVQLMLESLYKEDHSLKISLIQLENRFRANIIIEHPTAFIEEKWKSIEIDGSRFEVVGPCNRCQMICIDQETGQPSSEVIRCLSDIRDNWCYFGVHLKTTVTLPGARPSPDDSSRVIAINSTGAIFDE